MSLSYLGVDGGQWAVVRVGGILTNSPCLPLPSLDRDARVHYYKRLVSDPQGALKAMAREEVELAWSVAVLGDINGDGLPEVVLASQTAPNDPQHGPIHVAFLRKQA